MANPPESPPPTDGPRIAIFAPNPLLTVTLEREGSDGESVHFHPGGQGVWVARMATTMGAVPVLCSFVGGEPGRLLAPLLHDAAPGGVRAVPTAAASGCYVTDRRSGERDVLCVTAAGPPSRHEVDDLFSVTCAEAIACGWLVVTNPLPADALPLELYGDLVADARANGVRVLVDLSSPRLDSALRGAPQLVKLNDWELAQYVVGPVSEPAQMRDAVQRLRHAGAETVIVTRGGDSALVFDDDGDVTELTPPRFERGFREGCGDAMMGALAARLAQGDPLEQALVSGAAAGAANFLRHGLGNASRAVVDVLAGDVRVGAPGEWASPFT